MSTVMESNVKNDVEIDDLICPITLRLFDDPVIAADGHTYERAAIVRWITECGTSPLTRQPLNINELQPDDYLRKIAAQRRSSMTSYSCDINHDHASLQRQGSTVSYNYNTNIDQTTLTQLQTMPNNNIALISGAGNHYVSRNYVRHQHRCEIRCVIVTLLAAVLLIVFYTYTAISTNERVVGYSDTTTTTPTTTIPDEVHCWLPIPILIQEWCCPRGWTCGNEPGKCNQAAEFGTFKTLNMWSKARYGYPRCELSTSGAVSQSVFQRRMQTRIENLSRNKSIQNWIRWQWRPVRE